MKDVPTISVLMTAYNRAKYIAAAIESVLASTRTDFELVIVDDGSSDGTQDVAKGYASRDSRIRFHQNETNLGDYPNRNRAAELARGPWLKYVDADDYLYPTGLATIVCMLDLYPDVGYGIGLPNRFDQPYPIRLSPEDAYHMNYFRQSIFHKSPISTIINANAWRAVGGFSVERMTGDTDMWHRLSKVFPVVLMPPGIGWYRHHEAQETSFRSLRPDVWIPRYQAVTQRALEDPHTPLTLEQRKLIARRMILQNCKNFVRASLKIQINEASTFAAQASTFAKVLSGL